MPKSPPDIRQRLEVAVTETGRAIDKLSKTFELGKLSAEDLNKAFAYLRMTLTAAEQRARLSLQMAPVTNGFSLDAELPAASLVALQEPTRQVLFEPPEQQPVNFGRFASAPSADPKPAPLSKPTVKSVGGRFVKGTPRPDEGAAPPPPPLDEYEPDEDDDEILNDPKPARSRSTIPADTDDVGFIDD